MGDEATVRPIDRYPGHTLTVLAYTRVRNAAALLKQVVGGALPGAFVRSALVVDWLQLLAVATAVLEAERTQSLITRTRAAELVVRLAASRNISASLKSVGIGSDTTDMLVLLVDATAGDVAQISAAVDGERVELYEPSQCVDHAAVIQQYELTEAEQRDMVLAVVTRIAVRHI